MSTEIQKRKPKLHELLAALGDAEARSTLVQKEANDTFTKKASLFIGADKTLKMFDEKDAHLEAANAQHKELTTTVSAKLDYIKKDIARWWDAFLQKESTNQNAKADLVVAGEVIASDLPAAFFLGMEKELKALRKVYEAIPTLQPGIRWERDENLSAQDNSKGVYRNMTPSKNLKTKQTMAHKVLVPATDHHPAQIEKWSEQVPIGEFTEEVYSGMITPAEKSQMLQRLSALIIAMKKARMRANNTEVTKSAIGKKLFKFIHEGVDLPEE
jgi:hypothetical protein